MIDYALPVADLSSSPYRPSTARFLLLTYLHAILNGTPPPLTVPVPVQAVNTPGPQSHNAVVDIFEAERDKVNSTGQVALQSSQFAPFKHDYVYLNDSG
jgi:hypothetical protein